MNWHFCIDSVEKIALDHCFGSMNDGDGYGKGGGCDFGDGWGGGLSGNGYGDGRDYGLRRTGDGKSNEVWT